MAAGMGQVRKIAARAPAMIKATATAEIFSVLGRAGAVLARVPGGACVIGVSFPCDASCGRDQAEQARGGRWRQGRVSGRVVRPAGTRGPTPPGAAGS